MRVKRSYIAIVVILTLAIALCTSLWVNEGPLWRLLITKKIPLELITGNGHPLRGWVTVLRRLSSACYGPEVLYFVENGLLYRVVDWGSHHQKGTTWSFDGTVQNQWHVAEGKIKHNTSPPWWWDGDVLGET